MTNIDLRMVTINTELYGTRSVSHTAENLQMLYSISSERMLMEQLEYNLLYRWFVGMSMNEAVWHPDRVLQESRPVAGGRDRRGVFPRGVAPGAAQTAVVGRALHVNLRMTVMS
jgi:hypothetical protein